MNIRIIVFTNNSNGYIISKTSNIVKISDGEDIYHKWHDYISHTIFEDIEDIYKMFIKLGVNELKFTEFNKETLLYDNDEEFPPDIEIYVNFTSTTLVGIFAINNNNKITVKANNMFVITKNDQYSYTLYNNSNKTVTVKKQVLLKDKFNTLILSGKISGFIIDGRKLKDFLGYRKDFSTWIKNIISKYQLIENTDFIKAPQKRGASKTGQVRIEYTLTSKIAQKISIKANTDIGDKLADYLYDLGHEQISKKTYTLPRTYSEALRELADTTDALMLAKQKIMNDEPKLQYHDTVLNSPNLFTTTQIALEIGMTANALHKFLHEKHVIYRQGKVWILYKEHLETRIGGMATYVYVDKSSNTKHTRLQLKWTQKGRKFIHGLIKDCENKKLLTTYRS